MPRSILIILCAFLAIFAPAAVKAEERPVKPVTRSVTLQVPGAGMAAVPVAFRIATTPIAGAGGLRAVIQASSARGWVTVRTVATDHRGIATGTIVSNRPGDRQYRAALLSLQGRVIATSRPAAMTWSPLVHEVALACDHPSSPVGVDLPCEITVTPPVKVDNMITVLQTRVRSDWLTLEAALVPSNGILRTHVTGLTPGDVGYRVVLMRDARVHAESSIVTIVHPEANSLLP